MEEFSMAIPGSFRADWDTRVWKKVGSVMEDESEVRSPNEVVQPRMDTTVPTIYAMPLVIRRPLCSVSIRSVLRQITHLITKLTLYHPPVNITTLPPGTMFASYFTLRQGGFLPIVANSHRCASRYRSLQILRWLSLLGLLFPPINDTLSQAQQCPLGSRT